jgi:hypothetical protein
MSMQRRLFPLSCILLLSAMIDGEARAQGLPPPFTEYAAKFTCGRVPPSGPAGGGDADVVVPAAWASSTVLRWGNTRPYPPVSSA